METSFTIAAVTHLYIPGRQVGIKRKLLFKLEEDAFDFQVYFGEAEYGKHGFAGGNEFIEGVQMVIVGQQAHYRPARGFRTAYHEKLQAQKSLQLRRSGRLDLLQAIVKRYKII